MPTLFFRILLELKCRSLSLIPQSSKFSVSKAEDLNEALGTLPSIAESTGREGDDGELEAASAVSILRDAVGGRPARVVDKSRLRYVLYRSGPSTEVLRWTLKLLPHHPEHIDAFAAFLQNYKKSGRIMRHINAMLQAGVLYDYVQGEFWLIAARIGQATELRALLPTAQTQGKRKHLPFSMRRGLLAFFMSCRNAGVYADSRALKRFKGQTPYVQSLAAHYLADADFRPNSIVVDLIHAEAPAPGMVLASQLVDRALSVKGLGVRIDQLAPEVKNVFQGLGLIEGQNKTRFDQIGDVLRNRYGVAYWRGWRALLGDNYQHVLELLLTAEFKFLSDRSGWLSSQNSFNDAVFRAFQVYLNAKGLAGAVSMVDPKGKLHPFGRLLDKDTAFSKAFTTLSAALRAANDRRNSIPDSHPFEFKSGKRTRPLRVRERVHDPLLQIGAARRAAGCA